MKISIVCVGKIKENFYRQAIEEYAKRLSKYCKLEILEVVDEKTPDKASDALEDQIKEKEADRILEKIKEDAYVFTLEIKENDTPPRVLQIVSRKLQYKERVI